MNIILVLVDSLNKDCLSTYNPNTECKAPNVQALAERGHVFDDHYVGSLPCMPARREIMAGRKEFLWRPWGGMEVFDPRMPKEISKTGMNTAMVTDHYHYWEEEANGYMQGFGNLQLVRGHEVDSWKMHDPNADDPQWVKNVMKYRAAEHIRQYAANVKDFKGEEDYFAPKVFQGAMDWLDENAGKGDFFLQVECFDVHEPFEVPEPYASMYTDGDKNDFNIWPPYQVYADLERFMDETTPEELAFLKAQYMGKVTMMDTWLGKFMAKLDAMNLWEDTMVVFTTDHGHDLGARRAFGKQFPHYDSHANIPMIVWHPGSPGKGRRVKGLTQTVDLFATLIDAAGGAIPASNRHSKSILPMITDNADSPHEALIYGTFGQGLCVTDGDYTLFRAPVEGKPLFTYSTAIFRPLIVDNPVDGRVGKPPETPAEQGMFDPSVDLPLWKTPISIDPRTYDCFLYNRADDPGQVHNLWDSDPAQKQRMLHLARKLMDAEGYPAEQLERLGMTDADLAAA
ncbi:sulfatase [Cognatishimia maritima]|uniref:Arylsulfatase A n=1 Tax=Cognatishimia maritima TaxID=870908 RepID=A0A1M5USS5_9RHOB|nr:sulfatase [Cognatishimia maritima]SHH65858.1 Arylsulfatase A [Cognatishimia maritima]